MTKYFFGESKFFVFPHWHKCTHKSFVKSVILSRYLWGQTWVLPYKCPKCTFECSALTFQLRIAHVTSIHHKIWLLTKVAYFNRVRWLFYWYFPTRIAFGQHGAWWNPSGVFIFKRCFGYYLVNSNRIWEARWLIPISA